MMDILDEDLEAIENLEIQEAAELSLITFDLETSKLETKKTFTDNIFLSNRKESVNSDIFEDLNDLSLSSEEHEDLSLTYSVEDSKKDELEIRPKKSEKLLFPLPNLLQMFPTDGDNLPSNWDRIGLSRKNNQTTFSELNSDRYEFKEVCKALGSLVENGLVHVKRYQNLKLWHQYLSLKQIFLQNQSRTFSLNECFLIYELKRSPKYILDNEWNISRSLGPFGIALYFRDKPMVTHGKKQELLVCKVMLGDIKAYPDDAFDPSLTKPPCKENSVSHYHSVQGCISQRVEYIVYDICQVYPEYLVTVIPIETSVVNKLPCAKKSASSADTSHESMVSAVRMALKKTSSTPSTDLAEASNFPMKLPLKTLTTGNTDFSPQQKNLSIQTLLDDLMEITGLEDRLIAQKYLELAQYEVSDALEFYLYSLL